MKNRNGLLLILAVVVTVSGCTDQGGSEPMENSSANTPDDMAEMPVENSSTNSSSDVRQISVTGGNYYFEPSNIDVEAGETVRFVFENAGGTHDMRIPELGEGTNVISGGESESFTVTFEEEGSYEFLCSVGNHAQQGMTGTIQVS